MFSKRVRGLESNVWGTEDKSIGSWTPDGCREIYSLFPAGRILPLIESVYRVPLNLGIRTPAKHVKLVTLRTVFL